MRTDIGGQTKAFASDCHDAGIRFSIGYELRARAREAIVALPDLSFEGASAEPEPAKATALTPAPVSIIDLGRRAQPALNASRGEVNAISTAKSAWGRLR